MLPRIDRYEITQEIGHGGMATVYRARDSRLDRWVAVKVMHPHLRGTEQARARFSREARAVAKLKHPSILEIYDYSGNQSDDAFIATELLTGPTLRAFVEQAGDVPAEIAACIGVELAGALAAAHAQGIVHRDVKPENVLLHENRSIKLTDFGIADMLEPNMSAMTATGQILGSPSHMAPEQVEGGDTDARSDVFALGTILYWLATGSLPFLGKNPHQVLKRVVECDPVDPLVLKPSVGRPMRDVIMRCLAKDPAARFQAAEDLASELVTLLRNVGIDDAHTALQAYLRDPGGEAARLQVRVLRHLLAHARVCVAERDRLRAVPLLDRVLALADGDPDALSLLNELDHASRRRLLQSAALACVAVGLVAALWIAFAPQSGAVPASALALHKRADKSAAPDPANTMSTPDGTAPGMAPKPPAVVAPVPVPDDEREAQEREEKRPFRPARPPGTVPRTVVFHPEPANVTISVDGAAPRPFGPSFRMIVLPPGRHTFRFVGAHECCEEREITLEIPAGPGETLIDPKLPFRRARLYVTSDVHADVKLDDGLAVGRTRSLINIPIISRLIERRRISVTAPGYEPYTGTVELRAGQVSQLEVVLKPSASR